MYLSDIDLLKAIKRKELIVEPHPSPDRFGSTSIDLELDRIEEAKVWDIEALARTRTEAGDRPNELRIGQFDYRRFSGRYLISPPNSTDGAGGLKVFRRDNEIIIKPGGFLLWQTKETVGTPEHNSKLICFIDGKSTRARTGLLVHLTAPTIHAGWSGRITLEIANLGPFDFVLSPGEVIAQIIVAKVSSPPARSNFKSTLGQRTVHGAPQEMLSAVSTNLIVKKKKVKKR